MSQSMMRASVPIDANVGGGPSLVATSSP